MKKICVTEWEEPNGDILLKAKGIYYPFFVRTIERWKRTGQFQHCLRAVAEGYMIATVPEEDIPSGSRFSGKKYYVTVGE